jgi:cytochrome c oxidase assembly factor CtaG
VEWSRARVASFVAGVALVVAAVTGPLHSLQFDLLAAHLLQNVVLAEWAPALLVFGLPAELGRSLARVVPFWAALPVWLVTYYAWHVPPVYDAALEHSSTLLQLEHLSYLLAGTALWLPLAHGSISSGAKAAYVFAAFVLVSPLGLLLLFLPSAAYDFYDGHWGLTALEDQQVAGVTMVSEAGIVFFAALAFYFARFAREQS